jgi:hypothetical protein
MQQQLRQWLNEELKINNSMQDKTWSESLAAGSEGFVVQVRTLLGTKSANRKVTEIVDKHALGEQSVHYNIDSGTENTGLRFNVRVGADDLLIQFFTLDCPRVGSNFRFKRLWLAGVLFGNHPFIS